MNRRDVGRRHLMRIMRIGFLAVTMCSLLGCATASPTKPAFVLNLKPPIIDASVLDRSSLTTIARFNEEGKIQQAVQPAGGDYWTVHRAEVPPARIADLLELGRRVPPRQFRRREQLPRFFTVRLELPRGTTELVYNDGTLPCGDEGYKAFRAFWVALASDLPSKLTQKDLPRCSAPKPPANNAQAVYNERHQVM